MKKLMLLFVLLGMYRSQAQEMTPKKLIELISQVADTMEIQGNSTQFAYEESFLICIYDENANRMRIISPIVKKEELEDDQILNALVANFHSALDVKYALSDEIIWSVFIHPLKELTDYQVLDAIDQVHAAAINFGTTYSSTSLVFPGNTKKKEKPKKTIEKTKI